MSDTPPASDAGLQTSEAQGQIGALETAARQTADAIDKAFSRAGESLTRSLAKAASDGKLSLAELARSVLGAVESFATSGGSGQLLGGTGTLVDALGSVLKGVFGGAKADGGAVSPGAAYLVGERGPEVFRPSTPGEIAPAGGGAGVVVNVTVAGGGATGLLRSEAQIASALARAVSLGARP